MVRIDRPTQRLAARLFVAAGAFALWADLSRGPESVLSLPTDLESNAFTRAIKDTVLVANADGFRPIDFPPGEPAAEPPDLRDAPAGLAVIAATRPAAPQPATRKGASGKPAAAMVRPNAGRVPGRWHRGHGLRFRVIFLKARRTAAAGGATPRACASACPVYAPDDEAAFEVEFVSETDRTLTDLSLLVWQERFDPSGGPGRFLLARLRPLPVPALAPGGRVSVRGAVTIRSRRGLEQTHVRVSRSFGEAESVLADEPQAGVVSLQDALP